MKARHRSPRRPARRRARGAPGAGVLRLLHRQADTKLFNQASQVVLVRHDDKTFLTMANDFRGDLKEFAIVVPVPTVLGEGEIRVSDRALIEHLDAYSAAPARRVFRRQSVLAEGLPPRCGAPGHDRHARPTRRQTGRRGLGVTIEARYTVGEYNILILSAPRERASDLAARQRLPPARRRVVRSWAAYSQSGDEVLRGARESGRAGAARLHVPRPLQMAFESPKFMLPIRLAPSTPMAIKDSVRLRADAQGPRGDHELPHGAAADGWSCRLVEGGVFRSSTARCSAIRSSARTCARCFLESRGTWLVRSLRRRPASRCKEAAPSSASSGCRRAAPTTPVAPAARRRADVFVDAPARAVRCRALPRRPRSSRDRDRGNFQGRYVLRHP